MSITKIAERAGVSIATVSRVLNNSRPVNPEIAAAVRKAMEELNIQPRKRARKAEKQSTIAVVAFGQPYRGWFDLGIISTVIGEITRVAQGMELGVLLAEMPDLNEIPNSLRRADVAGALVFLAGHATAADTGRLSAALPIVRVLGGELGPMELDQVGVDNNAVGYLAADYLAKNNLKQFAFLTDHAQWGITQLRAQGFLAGSNRFGCSVRAYVVSTDAAACGFYGTNVAPKPTLEEAVKQIKQDFKGRFGLFVPRDQETVVVYRLLAEAGLQPDKDVVIVSCDNDTARMQSLHPRPASIDLNPGEIAHRSVRRLISRIKHRNEPPVRILVSPSLQPIATEMPAMA